MQPVFYIIILKIMSIAKNIQEIKKSIPENVKLIAISKTKPDKDILEAYNAGQKIFGENKVQDLIGKYERLPKDIKWHMVGHLQTNKVKLITPFIDLIHAVDSMKLLKTINKEAKKNNRVIRCLLQLHIAQEETKFGFSENEVDELLGSQEFLELSNIEITGLMGMATFTDDESKIRTEFKTIKNHFTYLKQKFFSDSTCFKELSFGMTNDYKIAIEEGSTMIRIGTLIFGTRNY